MQTPISVLILEDRPSDAELMLAELCHSGYDVRSRVVDKESEFLAALTPQIDIVLADWTLPSYSAPRAFQQLGESGLDIPFIIVSGTIDDRTALDVIKQGATDYVLKQDLVRLGAAVTRALEEKRLRQEQLQARQELLESENRFRLIAENANDLIGVIDMEGRYIYASPSHFTMLGHSPDSLIGTSPVDFIYPGDPVPTSPKLDRLEFRMRCADGGYIWVEASSHMIEVQGKQLIVAIGRNITKRKLAEDMLRQRADEFAMLYQIMLELSAHEELETLKSTIVERSRQLVHVREAALYTFDPPPQALVCASFTGTAAPRFGKIIPIGQGPVGQAAQSGKTVRDFGSGATMAVPMLYSANPVGVICVSDPGETGFTDAEEMRLAFFAAQAASAFHNVNLLDQVRTSRERLRALSQRLLQAQETERRALARELHDQIGQALTALQMNLQVIEPLISQPHAQLVLEDSLRAIEQTMRQVRDLSRDLRPSILDDFGLVPALKWLASRSSQQGGVAVEVDAVELPVRPPIEIETVCFRVAQEAMNNAFKHARANNIWINLDQCGGELHLAVRDDGVGFETKRALDSAVRGSTFGLLGMQERVLLAGGSIDIDSSPGRGTSIRARLPWQVPHSYVERRLHRREGP